MKISSTLDVNDKLATKALTEANEFDLENNYLEVMLHQTKKEVESIQRLYETKLLELLNQIHSKTKQMEQVQLESEYKSNEAETLKKLAEETHKLLSKETLMLQSEIETLTRQNICRDLIFHLFQRLVYCMYHLNQLSFFLCSMIFSCNIYSLPFHTTNLSSIFVFT